MDKAQIKTEIANLSDRLYNIWQLKAALDNEEVGIKDIITKLKKNERKV